MKDSIFFYNFKNPPIFIKVDQNVKELIPLFHTEFLFYAHHYTLMTEDLWTFITVFSMFHVYDFLF